MFSTCALLLQCSRIRLHKLYTDVTRVHVSIGLSSQFIAHPACQRQLIGLWYSDIPWMRHQHVIIKLLAVPLTTLLLPLFSLVFLFAPSSIVSHAAASIVSHSASAS